MTTIEEALEGSTPLAMKVRALGPYRSANEMIDQMRATLPTLSEEEKVATLNAHPRIGEDPGRLSARSLAEQGSDSLPELERLNAEYERRFGFRFVVHRRKGEFAVERVEHGFEQTAHGRQLLGRQPIQ